MHRGSPRGSPAALCEHGEARRCRDTRCGAPREQDARFLQPDGWRGARACAAQLRRARARLRGDGALSRSLRKTRRRANEVRSGREATGLYRRDERGDTVSV